MRKILVFFLSYTLFVSFSGFPQNDLFILNKDTIRGKVVETTLDTLSYISNENGKLFYITENSITVDTKCLIHTNRIDFIHFAQNPDCEFTTTDLLRKLDFSSNSPNIKSIRDYSTSPPSYKDDIDTVNNKIFWFGLDFSQVKIKLGKAPRTQYSAPFFLDCNDYMLSKEGITNFRKHFNFNIDTKTVTNRNNGIDFSTIYNEQPQILPLDTIRKILRNYQTYNTGVGLVIFVSNINKENETITYYTTFFDLKTRTVTLCLKETAKTAGVGMTNHWTKPIIEKLDYLIKKEGWKKKYIGKL